MLLSKLRLKSKNSKDSVFIFWRILNTAITGTLLAGVIIAIFFIYRNINMTLVNTAMVIDLKSKITFNSIDLNGYGQATKSIEQKKAFNIVSSSLKNMFTYEISTTTAKSKTGE